MRKLISLLIVIIFAGCTSGSDSSSKHLAELKSLHDAKDFFSLREQLESTPERESPEVQFYRAAVQSAFNQPAQANATIEQLLSKHTVQGDLLLKLRKASLSNHLRLHQYRKAYEVAVTLLAEHTSAEDETNDVKNMVLLLKPLADIPPQETTVRANSVLQRVSQGRIPVRFGKADRNFVFDTGANFSILMRSEAESLGLVVRKAGLEVGTATDAKVLADVAVAEKLTIGNIDYKNVVFLVFPDELLTFPGGFRIPGIIGFPVIETMREVIFRRGGVIEIPANPSPSTDRNLALEGLVPLIRVQYENDTFVCRFDTGASHTVFYQSFFRRYKNKIEALGNLRETPATGVGGTKHLSAYSLPEATLTLGGGTATLKDTDVFTQSIVDDEEDNYLFCNIGLDFLGSFDHYTMNFQTMSLQLGRKKED